MTAALPATQGEPLAVLSGGGSLPPAVAAAAARSGRRVVVFALRGFADAAWIKAYPHHWIGLGQLGHFYRLLRREGCRDIVFIGNVVRPAFTQLRLDLGAIRIVPRLWRAYRGGDDHLLSTLAGILEEQGFRLVAAHDVAPTILAPSGPLATRHPSEQDEADIARGLALITAMGPFDVGQAVVVANAHVLAVEAAEGTDGMLMRVAQLRREGRIPTPNGTGVLVKAPKPGQDHRFDLPTVGPRTADVVKAAGLGGLAVMAGATLVADAATLAQRADEAGIFVVGVPAQADA